VIGKHVGQALLGTVPSEDAGKYVADVLGDTHVARAIEVNKARPPAVNTTPHVTEHEHDAGPIAGDPYRGSVAIADLRRPLGVP